MTEREGPAHVRRETGFPPTLETVNGVLKSRPPTSRKPHGEGPFSVTVCGMLAISKSDRQMTDRQVGRQADRLSEGPSREITQRAVAGVLRPAARQRGPV